MNTKEFKQFLEKSKADFRFRYCGGGYFRDKNVPMAQFIPDGKGGGKFKTEKADIIHGGEILEEFCKELVIQFNQQINSINMGREINWLNLRKELIKQGVKIDFFNVSWDTNAGNSCYVKGEWGGYSVNSLAYAYAKHFKLNPKPIYKNNN